MRTDVEPGANGVAVAMQDQRLVVAIDAGFGFEKAAVLDLLEPRQCRRLVALRNGLTKSTHAARCAAG